LARAFSVSAAAVILLGCIVGRGVAPRAARTVLAP
jgi:hypothetical protein